MQTIIQITAWVVLAVGFFTLGCKFFPNFKKWLTTGKVSYVWLITISLGIFVLLTYPYFFNWWAINFWGVPKGELSDLGPLGDIYGSLNSLISSIALCAVAYSTILQIKELRLSRTTYKDQLSETKFANFSNLFYSLLNHKQTKYNNFRINNEEDEFDSIRIFNAISKRFLTLVRSEWNDEERLNDDTIKKELHVFLLKLTKRAATSQELNSYFLIYGDLLNLIKRSGLSLEDENFFKEIIRHSMTMSEQVTLLWMAAYIDRYKIFLKDSGIFNQFFHEDMMVFAKYFYDESYFSNSKFLENWNIESTNIEDLEKGTPA
ncbi:hypothetical protein [Acinetobacter pittii]|uniref:hypothetical protein n=1 Tax=Acinetobacter pittii TaxID=48296 RepID=UPI0021EFFD3C|nr:hypothetical protein MWMV6_MWMV6_02413 [Acinetobacter baumannii]CAI4176735.1 hypothetical protein MWMV1_MWMV1_02413 [Acinetobacter baumannii]